MRILSPGSTGPSVQFLQLALGRAGIAPLETDGLFGPDTLAAVKLFQASRGLKADGLVGPDTVRALYPWYTGYVVERILPGQSLSSIANKYGSSLAAISTANPGLDPELLLPGRELVVPLPFSVVQETVSVFSGLISYCVRGLAARYPFIRLSEAGRSVMGRPIWSMQFGQGSNRVLYNAAHHANEWICTLVLLRFVEELARSYAEKGLIYGQSAAEIADYASVFVVPAVNPDGIDLCTGHLNAGPYYESALKLASDYPRYPFPSGWKANIRGIDLNLQYPAMWEQARENKFAQGIVSPAPGDYVGDYPLQAVEAQAMYQYTRLIDPALVLAYHTQGEVIYWRYLDYQVEGAAQIAEAFAQVSGYSAQDTPFASGFAGYKDWFIESYLRPGFTIEAGKGKNPLPIEDFGKIYSDNLGILTLGTLVT